VTGTASAANLDFVRGFGADEVIDYRAERFEDVVRDVDVVFDTVGGETLERSWGVLKPGGRLVTVAASGERTTDERIRAAYFIVEPSRTQLAERSHGWSMRVRSARSLAPCSRSPRRGRRISTSLAMAKLFYAWLTVRCDVVRRWPSNQSMKPTAP
jgi:NADPH:quinone reductase-like Zn-dependent oxidoreductase